MIRVGVGVEVFCVRTQDENWNSHTYGIQSRWNNKNNKNVWMWNVPNRIMQNPDKTEPFFHFHSLVQCTKLYGNSTKSFYPTCEIVELFWINAMYWTRPETRSHSNKTRKKKEKSWRSDKEISFDHKYVSMWNMLSHYLFWTFSTHEYQNHFTSKHIYLCDMWTWWMLFFLLSKSLWYRR